MKNNQRLDSGSNYGASIRLILVSTSRQLGGAEIALFNNLVFLSKRFNCMLVCTPELHALFGANFKAKLPTSISVHPVLNGFELTPSQVVNFPRASVKILNFLYCATRLRRYLRSLPQSVVYLNDTLGVVTYKMGWLFSQRHRALVHVRDDFSSKSINTFKRLVLRWSLGRVSFLIANSNLTKEGLKRVAPSKASISVIPTAINAPLVPDRNQKHKLPEGKPLTIGMVSRISAQKGQLQLLKAFSNLDSALNVNLRIVGSPLFGEEKEYYRLLAFIDENNLFEKVEIKEQVAPSQVYDEIAKMDICVHPSTAPEPLGQIVIQYLKMARPTVVTNHGGYLDWIHDGSNALIAEPNNIKSLQEKLEMLIENADIRNKISENAGKTVYPSQVHIHSALAKVVQEVEKGR